MGKEGLRGYVETEEVPGGADPARDQAGEGERRLLVGRTNGGRVLTLVIERTVEPTTWLIVTGWTATDRERKIIG